jgi:hypothetical protein
MSRAIEQLVDSGQRMATADDLAEAVAAAVPREPGQRKAVLLLSTGNQDQDELTTGTELRRTGRAAAGEGFTLKLGAESAVPRVVPAPDVAPASEKSPATSSRRRWWLGAAVLMLIGTTVGIVARGAHTDPVVETTRLLPTPAASAAEPAPLAVLSAEPPTLPASSAIASAKPEAHPPTHAAPHPREIGREMAPTGSTEAQTACRGQLHIYATHGWMIAGGPSPVQAPGRYEWPCGTYSLKATSRVDEHESRNVAVTVHETAPGVIDLR